MINHRDLLALSIIAAQHRGIDTTRAENALDRLDEERNSEVEVHTNVDEQDK